jgi:hypothetical protein
MAATPDLFISPLITDGGARFQLRLFIEHECFTICAPRETRADAQELQRVFSHALSKLSRTDEASLDWDHLCREKGEPVQVPLGKACPHCHAHAEDDDGAARRTTRDVAGILHVLTPQQMAEEIVRLDAALAKVALDAPPQGENPKCADEDDEHSIASAETGGENQ